MSRRATLIFNPVSGQGDQDQDLDTIKDLLFPEMDLDVLMTSKDEDAGQLVHKAVDKGAERVIVSGGDGTVSAVAEGLIHTGIPLGIIPRGTANALAAVLNIPNNIEKACQIILNGTIQVIDTARCNDKTMVLLTGVGFEAETIEDTNTEMKQRWGMFAYVLAGIQQLQNLQPFFLTIETEEEVLEISEATALTIANIAPPTSILAQGPDGLIPDDGMLDITIVTSVNLTSAVAVSYHLLQTALRGEAAQREEILYFRSKKAIIKADPSQKVVIDGEIDRETPIEIECVPQSLVLYVPQAKKMNDQ